MISTLHCRARFVLCFLLSSLVAVNTQDFPDHEIDFIKEEGTTENVDVIVVTSEESPFVDDIFSSIPSSTTNEELTSIPENKVTTTQTIATWLPTRASSFSENNPTRSSTESTSYSDDHWDGSEVSSSSGEVVKDSSTDDVDLVQDASTQAEDMEQLTTNELNADELITDEDTTEEWPAETCVIRGVECVEPVRCSGQGKIDCSPPSKELFFEDDSENSTTQVNSSSDTWLPARPRRSAFSSSRILRDRKKQEAARKRKLLPVEGTEDPRETPCWIEETLLCSTQLILQNCRGVGKCQPSSDGPEDSPYLADWEIAVIAILTVAGVFLLFLLVYVIYGSWRKKKVRPMVQRNGRSHS